MIVGIRQPTAIFECAIADACHAVRNHYDCQTAASGERILADACHAVRDRYACQTATSTECITVDACPTGDDHLFQEFGDVSFIIRMIQRAEDIAEMCCSCAVRMRSNKWDRDACQTRAIKECIFANDFHAARNSYAYQTATSVECIICNTSSSVTQFNACNRCVAIYHPTIDIANAVFDFDNAVTSIKRILVDACNAVRDRYACQRVAVLECTQADACHTVRDGKSRPLISGKRKVIYACDLRSVAPYDLGGDATECILANACHAVGDRNACQIIATVKRIFMYFVFADHCSVVCGKG